MSKTMKKKMKAEQSDRDEDDGEEDVPQKKKGKKPVLKFRLRRDAGLHFEKNLDFDPAEPDDEDNPREYEFEAGDTIESRRRLDKLFPNKFQLLEGHAPSQGIGGDDYDDPDEDPDKDRPVRSVEDARLRRSRRYLEEEELEGKPHLQKLARGERKSKAMEAYEKFGDDVTDSFEGAKEADFVVYKTKNGKHTIADADEPLKPLRKGIREKHVGKALKELQDE